MGCSSGSLAKAGQYEPSGPVLAYLMAGTHLASLSYKSACLGGYLLSCSLCSEMCYGQPRCLMRTATCFVCGMLLLCGGFCIVIFLTRQRLQGNVNQHDLALQAVQWP